MTRKHKISAFSSLILGGFLLLAPMARAQQPQPEPQTAETQTLPRTASDVPTIAVLGALTMVGATVVRRLRAAD
jgi:hypothetical protein